MRTKHSYRRVQGLLLLVALTLGAPGCAAVWGPVCAWEGEPYGMVRADLEVISGNKQPTILSDMVPLPVAILELPFASALDTLLLPLAVVRSWVK